VLIRFARWVNGWGLRMAATSDRKRDDSIDRERPNAPVRGNDDVDLDLLISRITTENRHEEICTGSAGSCSKGNVA